MAKGTVPRADADAEIRILRAQAIGQRGAMATQLVCARAGGERMQAQQIRGMATKRRQPCIDRKRSFVRTVSLPG